MFVNFTMPSFLLIKYFAVSSANYSHMCCQFTMKLSAVGVSTCPEMLLLNGLQLNLNSTEYRLFSTGL
jgi:hypothetical protein